MVSGVAVGVAFVDLLGMVVRTAEFGDDLQISK